MSRDELIERVKILTPDATDEIVGEYVDMAVEAILERMYPYGTDETECPDRYAAKAVSIAVYLVNKRGAEGEVHHSENGVLRIYEKADVPDSMLYGIVPMVKLPV